MSDGAVVLATLRRARRRLIAGAFVRATCLALVAAAAALAAARLLADTPLTSRTALTAAVVVLVLGGAAAWWQRPTLPRTAAVIDARLGLADLTVAAHGLRDSERAMARLVVRDARQRLEAASLSRVLPMPRRLATWTTAGSGAAMLLGLLAGGADTPAGRLVPAGGAGRSVSGGNGGGDQSSTSRPAEGSAPGAASMAPRLSRDGPGQALPQAGDPRPGRTTDTAGNRARGTQIAGRAGDEGQAQTGDQATGRSGGAGRGGGDGQQAPAAGAGGVQQSRVEIGAAIEIPAAGPPTTGDLRRAAARAEAAMARDLIPPRLAPVVRRYFQAAQSEPDRR